MTQETKLLTCRGCGLFDREGNLIAATGDEHPRVTPDEQEQWAILIEKSVNEAPAKDALIRELVEALRAIDAGFRDGSIAFTKKRSSDKDPYHPANTLMCEALSKAAAAGYGRMTLFITSPLSNRSTVKLIAQWESIMRRQGDEPISDEDDALLTAIEAEYERRYPTMEGYY